MYETLKHSFRSQFRREAEWIFSAPGRTELSGNHTDHQHGCVLAAAVDLDTRAAVARNDEKRIRVLSEGYPLCVSLPDGELKPDRVYACGGGTIILKKVKLPDLSKGYGIFAEVTQYSDGDAYDRTGSIFVIPTGKEQSFIDAIRNLNSTPKFCSGGVDYHGLVSTPTYDVPVELMRFFTGFGVRYYNDKTRVPGQEWVDSVFYKAQVTPLQSLLHGEVWIGAYIGNWDSRGHRLSLRLKYFPDDLRHVLYDYDNAIPLFNTVNYLEQAKQPYPEFQQNDSLKVKFNLAAPVKNAQLMYITTGHGGWGGGDEFNQKPNTIYLDGLKVISFIPWRDDCGTYRNSNPQTGIYETGCSSSDMSRSNWTDR